LTIPCFLYIPKENTEQYKSTPQPINTLPVSIETRPGASQDTSTLKCDSNYVKILPKIEKKQLDFQFLDDAQVMNYCNSLNTGGSPFTPVSQFQNDGKFQQQTLAQPPLSAVLPTESAVIHPAIPQFTNKEKKRKLSKFEKKMNFINSKETQELFSNSGLIQCTIMKHNEKRKACRKSKERKGEVCRHKPLPVSVHANTQVNSTEHLISNYTQTVDTSSSQPLQVNTGIQTCNAPFGYPTVEVLETSDFGSQCQFTNFGTVQENLLLSDEPPMDNQTQTDNITSWLDDFLPSNNLSDMQTQTNFVVAAENIGLDKSVQLDDILSGKTWDTESRIYLNHSTNTDDHIPSLFMPGSVGQPISTQTHQGLPDDDIEFEISGSKITDKDIVLSSKNTNLEEPLSISFGSQTVFDDDDILDCSATHETLSFGTQTVFESNFFSSSATQTWEEDETSINAKTIETQTAISFADLLDSSYIDDYLNNERISSTETQTYQDLVGVSSKELITTETQT
jgi:hypothetical protein